MPSRRLQVLRRTRHEARGGLGRVSLLALAALLLAAAPGAARAEGQLGLQLMVTRICDDPGRIDPRGERVHEKIRSEFRYQSLEVVEQKQLQLGVDEVGGLKLPTGQKVEVRPMLIDERGALLAVKVGQSVDTDLRVRSGHLVIIGAERHDRCKLVISLEPEIE